MKKLLKSLLRIVIGIVVLGAILIVLGIIFVDSLIYYPPVWNGDSSQITLIGAESQKIAIIFFEPPADDAFTIIYSHGNAEDISDMSRYISEARANGYGIAVYDYSGYGLSDGNPSSKALENNIETVYNYLVKERGIKSEKIIAAAFSVGGGAACHLASKYRLAALVLEAPFASAFQAVVPFGGLPGDRLENDRKISSVKCPVLIFHGSNDSVIPIRNSEKLYRLANEPKTLVIADGANHNDLHYMLGNNYFSALSRIIAKDE